MLTSTRLSIDMLDRADRVPVPGLPNAIYSEKSERTAGSDATHSRALALATRIARVTNLIPVPLPKAMLVVIPTDEITTNSAESPPLETKRSMQVPVNDSRKDLAVSAARETSLNTILLSTKDLGKSKLLEALAPKPRSALSAIISVNRPSPSTFSSQNDAPSSPRPSVPPSVIAAIDINRTDGIVAKRRSDKPFPMKLVDEVLAASTGTSTHETRLPAPIAIMSKMPVGLADAVLRHPERPDLETKHTARSATALGLAAVLKSHRTDRVSDQLAGNAERRGSVPMWLPGRGSPGPRSGLEDMSDSQSDLRQRAVPTISAPTHYRTQGQEAVRRNPTSSAPAQATQGENTDSGARSLAPSQTINIVGALTVDNRRLGHLTASSQAREASLPARGPSRVNLRAVPIFSGMKIPS